MRGQLRRHIVMVLVGSMASAACAITHPSHVLPVPPAATTASAPAVYVAIGDGQTRGQGADNPLRQAWPHVVFRSLPGNYTLINLATNGATVASAINEQLPEAQALHPTLVTVWLNVDDVLAGLPAPQYQMQLIALLHALRATGAKVLVANTPVLDQLPAYLVCTDPTADPNSCPPFLPRPLPSRDQVRANVESYNAAIVQRGGSRRLRARRPARSCTDRHGPRSLGRPNQQRRFRPQRHRSSGGRRSVHHGRPLSRHRDGDTTSRVLDMVRPNI